MYVKLFTSILDSSIWAEDPETRIVWIAMLAMADAEGFVRGVESALARRANVPLPACRKALRVLSEPDVESQNQDFGGRRIEAVEGGWLILNYLKYREIRDTDSRRAQWREASKRHYQKRRSSQQSSAKPQQSSAQAEAEAEAEAGKTDMCDPDANGTDPIEAEFTEWWSCYPKRAGGNPRKDALKAYRARRKQRVTRQELFDGVDRYRRWAEATSKVGTEYVKMAKSWLSPSYEGWKEPWDLPPEEPPVLGFRDEDFL